MVTSWLDVYANNTRAIHLYEKLKFVRYNHGMENEREVFFYEKKLEE
jgi:ribosomal protein S18 acetylase RimI-like enzyme